MSQYLKIIIEDVNNAWDLFYSKLGNLEHDLNLGKISKYDALEVINLTEKEIQVLFKLEYDSNMELNEIDGYRCILLTLENFRNFIGLNY